MVEESVETEINPSDITTVESPLVESEESHLSVNTITESKDFNDPLDYWNNLK